MKIYTLEQCLEQQKKVDAGIKHRGEYNPIRAARAETVEMQEHLGLIKTWGENKIDMKQAFMELVDVQAFTMSALLLKGFEIKEIKETYEWNAALCSIDQSEDIGVETDKLAYYFCLDSKLNVALVRIGKICVNHFNRPITDIYYYYMGKQTLTRFRQKNGYKEGTYTKIWGSREDNEYLTEALESCVEIDELYDHLDSVYQRIVIAKEAIS